MVSGKLQVSKGGQAIAVLGNGACIGDWAVISGSKAKRSASLSCITECEIFVLHGWNFMR